MNIAESTGESSRTAQENGDATTGSERPLKKARFAWQVKGKYHLKSENSEITKNSTVIPTDADRAGSSGDGTSNIESERNHESLGDYLLQQDFNTIESVIADPEESILMPCTNISNEKLHYPIYVSSYEDRNVTKNAQSSDDRSHDLMSFANYLRVLQDTETPCIIQWQARQMAKVFVDNTINHMLEVPLPDEEDGSRFLALDVAEFINNLPGVNSIENKGILMAISAHGLQNTSNSSSNNDDIGNCTLESVNNFSASPQTKLTQKRSLSPSQFDNESHGTTNQCVTDISSVDNMQWSYEEQRNESDIDENVNDNHYDVLDAAVLFAIQSKGLTTLGADYG